MYNRKLTPELQKQLTEFANSHNISLEEMAQYINMILRRQHILALHKAPITQGKDGRWRTRTPDQKQIAKKRREDVEDAVIEYYIELEKESPKLVQPKDAVTYNTVVTATLEPMNNCTLKTIYTQWLELRKTDVSLNTLALDVKNWENYILYSNIVDIPLKNLNRTELKKWANHLLKENSITQKYFNNIKTVLNSLLDFAVDEGYIESNMFRNIKLSKNKFAQDALKDAQEEVFTKKEQEQIMSAAEQASKETHSALPLAICILFFTGIRIGELCGLKYKDIRGNYLYINRMAVKKTIETSDGLKSSGHKIVEHTKTSAGIRIILLPPRAMSYLNQIKELNQRNGFSTGPEDLIFQRKQGMCPPRVFNCRLTRYCKGLGFRHIKSCHDIRRTYITSLFDAGLNIEIIRQLAGHENIEMTLKYCRDRMEPEELETALTAALSS